MAIEVPNLPLQPGETIRMDQLFKHIGSTLFRQGVVPENYTFDEWAREMAESFKLKHVVDTEVTDVKDIDSFGEK